MEDKTNENRIGDWVLYKNNQFIAFNKPAGIPSQADQSNDKSMLQLAEIYTKQKLHLVHRLDRPASGILLFAKTKKAVQAINAQFQARTVEKIYLAAVKEAPPIKEATLIHYIKKDKRSNSVRAFAHPQEGAKEARLSYRLLGSSTTYHLLAITLFTGRHHQIRAQLQAIGSPIKGDVKYGFKRGNRDRSIHLHAWKLAFQHPISEKIEHISAPLPQDPIWDFFTKNGCTQ